MLSMVNVEAIQQAEQQISRRDRHGRVGQVTVALQLSVGAPDEDVGDVLVAMLIRVPHVRAIEHQRMIEQRPVSVRRLRQLVHEIREHGDVIAIQPGVIRLALLVLTVMRAGMKRDRDAAFRVRASGEVARVEHRGDAGDVRAERQREQIEVQLDVLVEGLRNPDRDERVWRRGGRGLCRDLQAPFDLAYILRVLVEAQAIGRIEPDLEPRQAADERVEDAPVVLPARGSLLGACCRPRTCARTRSAGSAPSAAGSSASTTRCCSCRRSCSLRRSCSSSRRDLRRRTASTGAGCPVRSSGRSSGRSSCRCRCRRPPSVLGLFAQR